MQYLLTEEEKAALVSREKYENLERALAWCFNYLQPDNCPHVRPGPYPYCGEANCPLEDVSVPRDLSRLICKLSRAHGK